jgi:hypothetical protein
MNLSYTALLLTAMLIISAGAVSAQTLEELETRIENLESSVGSLTSIVTGLVDQVNSMLAAFGIDAYGQCLISRFCEEPQVACSLSSDCGTDGWVTGDYCLGDDVYRDHRAWGCDNAGTAQSQCTSTSTPTMREACSSRCLDGACVECLSSDDCVGEETCTDNMCVGDEPAGPTECSFRTNAEDGVYRSGSWIAVDTNGDGTLEGFEYVGSTGALSHCGDVKLTETPEGYKVALDSYGRVMVCVPSVYQPDKVSWKKYWQTSGDAETSVDPTSPYTANGQEVCGGAASTAGTGDEGDEGGSVSVSGTIGTGTQ